MSRLIDADVAIENIEEWLDSVGTAMIGKGLSYTGELIGCIEDAPTVDAVPVVRCEYCNKGHPELGMNGCVWCVRYSRDMNTDDFCSYGERKEGADNE